MEKCYKDNNSDKSDQRGTVERKRAGGESQFGAQIRIS